MKYIVNFRRHYDYDDYGRAKWSDEEAEFDTLEEIIDFCIKQQAQVITKEIKDVIFNSIYKIQDNLLTENIQEEIKHKAQDKAKDILEARRQVEEVIKQTELFRQQEKERQEYLRLKQIYDNSI